MRVWKNPVDPEGPMVLFQLALCHSMAIDLKVLIHHLMILDVHLEILLPGSGAWVHLMSGLRKARPNLP